MFRTNRMFVLMMGMITMAMGGMLYAWSVIQPYILEYFSVEASTASIPFSINLGIFVIGSIIGGKLQIKNGVQKSLRIGIGINFVGLSLTVLVPPNAFWLLVIAFGVVTGIGGGIVYNTLITAMQKYFPDKKGMATGAILCMIGVSGFYMSPIINYILQVFSLKVMFASVAVASLAVGLIGSAFIKDVPENYMSDYKPSGNVVLSSVQYEPKEMLRTKSYYLISLSMMFCVVGFMLINPQFVLLSSQRAISSAMALAAVMAASISQAIGRLLIPSMSDKLGRKTILLVLFALSTATIFGIVCAKGMLYPILFVLLAFLYGGFLGTYPALSTDYFGTKNAGINYALVMIGFGLSSVLCPVLARAVKGSSIGLSMSFLIAGIISASGFVLMLLLRKPEQNQSEAL